jgi:mRNA interferase MazF
MKGTLVLVPFPFTDFSTTKLRPALVLLDHDPDIVIAFISSKIPESPSPAGIVLTRSMPDFSKTGLKTDSVIRLDKITTIIKTMVTGTIGELPQEIRSEVNRKMAELYRI